MSKKKNANTQAMRQSRAQIDRNALLRFERACEYLVGPGYFEKFSALCRQRLLRSRYDAVKMKMNGVGFQDGDGMVCREIFIEQLSKMSFTTAIGEEMPLSLYLREGLGLIYYVEAMKDQPLSGIEELAVVFKPYELESELMMRPVASLVLLLHRFSIIVSDWSKKLFVYSIKTLALYTIDGATNHISAESKKLESCVVKVDGISREVIRVGWTDIDGVIVYRSLNPRNLGFRCNSECFVYIQRHALQRLEERLGILPGVIHHSIYELFGTQEIVCQNQGLSSLIEFCIYGVKLGYLVCSLVDDKIVIRTFLFLTNDGTPEGNRLSELTKLELLDKEYLGIDTLEGFLSFNIVDDERLSALFTEAGCGGLLDLSDIKPYYVADVKEKDTEKLLGYLMRRAEEEVLIEEFLP
jgi:hypothetical protein